MTALVSFDRVFEVLDLPPMIDDKPDAVAIPRGPATHRVRPRRLPLPDAPRRCRWPRSSRWRCSTSTASNQVLFDVVVHRRAGPARGPGRAVGCGQDDHQPPRPPPLRRARRGRPHQRDRRARRHARVASRDIVGVVTQDAHLFHETIRVEPALRQARRHRRASSIEVARAPPRSCRLVESLPDGLDTLVGDRGYRLSGGEKQRIAIARLLLKAPDIVVLDEATAHLDSESEVAVQQALKTALAGRTSLVIAHRLSTVREADVILVVDRGPHRRAGPPRRAARRRRRSTPSSTGPSSSTRGPTPPSPRRWSATPDNRRRRPPWPWTRRRPAHDSAPVGRIAPPCCPIPVSPIPVPAMPVSDTWPCPPRQPPNT